MSFRHECFPFAFAVTDSFLLMQILQETMIEELHNHLYLKSPYCDTLWSAYIKDQQDLPLSTMKIKNPQNEIVTGTQNNVKDLFTGDNANMVRKYRLMLACLAMYILTDSCLNLDH